MITFLKNRKLRKEKAKVLYADIVDQSRLSVFYKDLKIPDSVDGRFEMTALHCYIVMHRLNKAAQGKQSQKLFDVFFGTMEHSLREMGIGDLGVPKHMKRMMQGFNGRANHYERALKLDDKKMLEDALVKNIYGTVEKPDMQCVKTLADYVMACANMESLEADFADLKSNNKEAANG